MPWVLLSLTIIIVGCVFVWVPALPQDVSYHCFAGDSCHHDHTHDCMIPYCGNVISNVLFVLVGAWGALNLFKNNRKNLLEWILVFGIMLTGFGSAYYHWNPTNETLVWDRLPMTLVFMSFFGLFYGWFFNKKTGQIIGLIGVLFGILSVVYWSYSESIGQGDLRLYAIVQFLPMLLIFMVLCVYFRGNKQLILSVLTVLGWYIIAKFSEHFDYKVYEWIVPVSGHQIKHIAAGIATFFMVKLVVKRN